jgi:hypothetical protein
MLEGTEQVKHIYKWYVVRSNISKVDTNISKVDADIMYDDWSRTVLGNTKMTDRAKQVDTQARQGKQKKKQLNTRKTAEQCPG